jgi:hypothetical protein
LTNHLKSCFYSQKFSDFVLILKFNQQELKIKTHKLVLSFYFLIDSDKNMMEMTIDDEYLTRDAVGVVLASLYGNDLDLDQDLSDLLSITSACKLFKLETQSCVQMIKSKICTETVQSIAEFLENSIYDFQDLRDALFTFLCKQFIESLVLEHGPIWNQSGSKAYDYAVGILSNLPFEWIKAVVESKHFEIPSEMER